LQLVWTCQEPAHPRGNPLPSRRWPVAGFVSAHGLGSRDPFSDTPTTRPLFGLVRPQPMGRRPAPTRPRCRSSATSGHMAFRPARSPPDPRGRATTNRGTNAQRRSGQRNPSWRWPAPRMRARKGTTLRIGAPPCWCRNWKRSSHATAAAQTNSPNRTQTIVTPLDVGPDRSLRLLARAHPASQIRPIDWVRPYASRQRRVKWTCSVRKSVQFLQERKPEGSAAATRRDAP
jgi:hypothetical protein